MSAFTIFDLVNMVSCGGGEPKFLDTNSQDVHLSLEAVKQAVDEKTAAVIVTHYHTINPEIQEIAAFCREAGIALIEDCAISIGGRVGGEHVGTFGDYAFFSFGLFKFVSTYFGGAMVARDPEAIRFANSEMAAWPAMNATDLLPYAAKGWKLSTLTHPLLFNLFTFPLFRFGYKNKIDWIRNQAQNDPDPDCYDKLPDDYRRRPSLFQISEFNRQLPYVEQDKRTRVSNASRYHSRLRELDFIKLPPEPNVDNGCWLNFPVQIMAPREDFVAFMMDGGFDASTYYYRNCSAIDAFSHLAGECPNLQTYVENMAFFPVYPGIDTEYIDRLTQRVRQYVN